MLHAPPGLLPHFLEPTTRNALEKDRTEIVGVFARAGGDSAFQATAQEALYLGNAELIRRLLAAQAGKLTSRLATLENDRQLATELYLAVFSRRPDKDETKAVLEFLSNRQDQRATAIGDLAWAMLTSAEFRFNH